MNKYIVLYHNNFNGQGPNGDLSVAVQEAKTREEAVEIMSQRGFVGEIVGICLGLTGNRLMKVERVVKPTFKVLTDDFVRIT